MSVLSLKYTFSLFFHRRIEIVRKRILRFAAAAAGGVDTHLNTPAAQPCAGAARQQTQTAFESVFK